MGSPPKLFAEELNNYYLATGAYKVNLAGHLEASQLI